MLLWSSQSKSVCVCAYPRSTQTEVCANGACGDHQTPWVVTAQLWKWWVMEERKMFCESQGDFWQFLGNVAEVITRLWWSAISVFCWDPEMCGGQNKMFDALKWGGKSLSVCQRYLWIMLEIGSCCSHKGK